MMKAIVNLFCLFLFVSPVMAQQGKKIEVLKIEFITRKLDLSPAEAEKFWPIYRGYQKELVQIFNERRRDRQEQKASGTPVDELKYESKVLEVRKRYRKEFTQAIPEQKVRLLFLAEREFRERLIRQLGERQHRDK